MFKLMLCLSIYNYELVYEIYNYCILSIFYEYLKIY